MWSSPCVAVTLILKLMGFCSRGADPLKGFQPLSSSGTKGVATGSSSLLFTIILHFCGKSKIYRHKRCMRCKWELYNINFAYSLRKHSADLLCQCQRVSQPWLWTIEVWRNETHNKHLACVRWLQRVGVQALYHGYIHCRTQSFFICIAWKFVAD